MKEISKELQLKHAAIQYRYAVRRRDFEAEHMWGYEMVDASGVNKLSKEEEQEIVEEYFLILFENAVESIKEYDAKSQKNR